MTIFRSSMRILASVLVAAQPVAAQAAPSRWTMVYSDSEELHKLIFVAAGDTEGEGGAYLRCRTGEGWIFLIHDLPQPRRPNYVTEIRSGRAVLKPSFRVAYDDVEEKFYFDAAIPADSAIIEGMMAGNSFIVDGTAYPVSTPVERKTVENFKKICSVGG